ncbi:MAG: hypothetical protein WC289_05780 [Patescibacteria group bacterium]|jgi:hypothetical protein
MNIEKLLICEPGTSRSTIHISIAHPTPVEEQMLGKLVLLAELGTSESLNVDIIHAVQKELQSAYYTSEELNTEVAFENALAKTNQKIGELVADYASNWYEQLNICAIVLHGQHVLLAEYGRVHAFLIHNERIIDILQTTPKPHESVGALKIFSNIVTGKIQPGEHMFVTTTSLLDYFSQEKLRRIIVEHQPQDAMQVFDSTLNENINQTAFGAVLVSARAEQSEQVAPLSRVPVTPSATRYSAPQTSMDRLIEREHTTQEFLTPSLTSHFKKKSGEWFDNFFASFGKRHKRSKIYHTAPEDLKEYTPAQMPVRTEQHSSPLGSIGKVAARIGASIGNGIHTVRKTFFPSDRPSPITNAPRHIGNLPSRIIMAIKRMPMRTQILLAIALIIIFIFSQSVVNMGIGSLQANNEEEYATTTARIDQLLIEEDAAFSYNNDASASDRIGEVTGLINNLPRKNDDQKKRADEYTVRLATLQERARRLTRIDTPSVAVDFNSVLPTGDISGSTLIGQEIFAFSSSAKNILRAPLNGTAEIYASIDTGNVFQYMSPTGGNTLLFYTTANTLHEFTINAKALRDLTFTFSQENSNIIDIEHYQSRLYMLDIANNQIWRSNRSGNGYGAASAWLQDAQPTLSEARSFAIDGSIYVLFANGSVQKYTRGAVDTFQLEAIDPALTSGTRIWTNEASDNIYILDSSSKRLIIFTKEGAFVKQFQSEQFANAKDLTVDTEENNAFILSGSKVFSIPLQ